MSTADLTSALDRLVHSKIIVGFDTATTNKKLVWTISTDDTKLAMTTAETRAFVQGVDLARARRSTGPRDGSYAARLRDALAEDGEMTVETTDEKLKVARTSMFNAAYALGLKGRFGVKTDRTDDGIVTLTGRVSDA